jgi:hypothetical protein
MISVIHGCHRWELVQYSILDMQHCLSFASKYVVFLPNNMSLTDNHPQILNATMWEGGFEDGIAKDPKANNTEILLSPPRGEGFATQKNLVHLPENRFWNPKSKSRIIENDARFQKWFKTRKKDITIKLLCQYQLVIWF